MKWGVRKGAGWGCGQGRCREAWSGRGFWPSFLCGSPPLAPGDEIRADAGGFGWADPALDGWWLLTDMLWGRPRVYTPATWRLSLEEQGSHFQDSTVWAGVHPVAHGVQLHESPRVPGSPVQAALPPSVTLRARVKDHSALVAKLASSPLAWLDPAS